MQNLCSCSSSRITSYAECDCTSPTPAGLNGLCMDDGRVRDIVETAHPLLDVSHSSKGVINSPPDISSRTLPTNLSIQVPKASKCIVNRSMNEGKRGEREKKLRFLPSLFLSMVPTREYPRRPSLLLYNSAPAATHLRTPSPCGPSPQLPPTPVQLSSFLSVVNQIDVWPGQYWHMDTYKVAMKAQAGLVAGKRPILAESCLSGSYLMRTPSSRLCAVFKPTDEEPSCPNNPKINMMFGEFNCPVKGRVDPGGGAVRECIAWLLDKENRAAVPPTSMATASSPFFQGEHPKDGSLQVYMRHECSAEDIGPSLFPLRDVQEIALLDIRLLNQDRHCGNILVSEIINLEEKGCSPCVECDADSGSGNSVRSPSMVDSDGDEIMVESGPCTSSPSSAQSRQSMFSSPLPSYTVDNPVPNTRRSASSDDIQKDSKAGVGMRLIPIDHGFCLPNPRSMLDTDLCWLQWPQSHIPLDASQRSYVSSLDPEQDIKLIQDVLGHLAPAQEYLMNIYIGTTLLQKGVEMGLSLYDIGCLMTRNGDPDKPSKLEWAVEMASADKKAGQAKMSIEDCGIPFKQALDTAIDKIVHEVRVTQVMCK